MLKSNPRIPCAHLTGYHRNNPFTRAMTPPPELNSSPSTRHQAKARHAPSVSLLAFTSQHPVNISLKVS